MLFTLFMKYISLIYTYEHMVKKMNKQSKAPVRSTVSEM